MTRDEIKLLRGLHAVIMVDPGLLDNEAYARYDELVKRAEKERVSLF